MDDTEFGFRLRQQQNLYTYDTDLGWSTDDSTATWRPIHPTIDFTGDTIDGWVDSLTEPYSANPGNVYYYTSNYNTNDIKYNSLQECITAGYTDCRHYHAGNYYNFSAAIADNDSTSLRGDAPNSICPAGWRIPRFFGNEIANLLMKYSIISSISSDNATYEDGGFEKIRKAPLYFTRAGNILRSRPFTNNVGEYWYDKIVNGNGARFLSFNSGQVTLIGNIGGSKSYGKSLRCLAR